MKKFLFVVAILLFGSTAYAQTNTFAWDYVGALPAEVATYIQSVTVDNTAVTTAPTCIAKGTTDTTCSVPITPLATGSHTVSVSASKSGITAQTTITGLNLANGPKSASNPQIKIVVTINIP